jgi:hypothetical protein
LSARALASITIALAGALEQDRNDSLLVENWRGEGISRRHGFRSLLQAKVQTLSGKA